MSTKGLASQDIFLDLLCYRNDNSQFPVANMGNDLHQKSGKRCVGFAIYAP